MAQVLEFDTYRHWLQFAMLRSFGLPEPLTWRVLGYPRDRLRVEGLFTSPFLVAVRRDAMGCLVNLEAGATPNQLGDQALLRAVLDAIILYQHLIGQGSRCRDVLVWLVYSDHGRMELHVPGDLAAQLWVRVRNVLRKLNHHSPLSTEAAVRGRLRELREHCELRARITNCSSYPAVPPHA